MKYYTELTQLLNERMEEIVNSVSTALKEILPTINSHYVSSNPIGGMNWYYNWRKMCITRSTICNNYFLRTLGDSELSCLYADSIKNSLKNALSYISSEKNENHALTELRLNVDYDLDMSNCSPGVLREAINYIAIDNYCSTKRYNPYALITTKEYKELSKEITQIREELLPKMVDTFKNLCAAKVCTLQEIHNAMLMVFSRDLAVSQYFRLCDTEIVKIVATYLFKEFKLIEDSFYRATSLFNDYDEKILENSSNKILYVWKYNAGCRKFFEINDFVKSIPDNFKAYVEQNYLFNRFIELYNNDMQQKLKTLGVDLAQYTRLVKNSHLTMSVSERAKLCKANFLLEQKHLEKLDAFAHDFARSIFRIYLQLHSPELELYQKILEFTIKIDDIAAEFKERYFNSEHNMANYFIWPNNRVKIDDMSDSKRLKYR